MAAGSRITGVESVPPSLATCHEIRGIDGFARCITDLKVVEPDPKVEVPITGVLKEVERVSHAIRSESDIEAQWVPPSWCIVAAIEELPSIDRQLAKALNDVQQLIKLERLNGCSGVIPAAES